MAKKKSRSRRAGVRGLSKNDVTGTLMQMGVGAVGAVLLKKVLDNVLPAQYAQYGNYAGLGVAVLAGGLTKNKTVQNGALGAGTVYTYNIVADLADGQGAAVSLLPPGVPSVRIAGPVPTPAGVVMQ